MQLVNSIGIKILDRTLEAEKGNIVLDIGRDLGSTAPSGLVFARIVRDGIVIGSRAIVLLK